MTNIVEMFGIEIYANEEWRDVLGFEGIYAVSNQGRLASFKSGAWRVRSIVNAKGGYFSIVLRYKKLHRSARMHRIVYESFVGDIPKGKNYHIHHINHNKQDNRVENLKLVTAKEHYHEDYNIHNYKKMNYYNQHIKPAKIAQYSLAGDFIAVFDNVKDASMATGVCQRNIKQVANQEPYNDKGFTRKQAGGFLWKNVN